MRMPALLGTRCTRSRVFGRTESQTDILTHAQCTQSSDDPSFYLPARRLLKKLCDITEDYPPQWFLKLDSVDKERYIGHGGFADIFPGRYEGQDVAVKRLRIYQSGQKPNERIGFNKSLLREVSTWAHLNNPSVLPFLGLDESTFEDYPPCIVTPLMRNGTLFGFVKERNATLLPDGRLNQLLFQTADGLAYLHSQNIVHGDLRGTNVLVDDDGHSRLADFGLAVVTDATRGTTSTFGGSVRWMAPELLDGSECKRPTTASDVYAFSCLYIELYTGAPPFGEMREGAVINQVSKGKRLPRPSSSAPPAGTRAMSDKLWETVEVCSSHNPSDRPAMNEALDYLGLIPLP
ncbi:kinase-like domain-containing protein [Mycena vitilis]|nr:kinase-like domain-containing protein [Mycena vitilis]